MDRITTHHEITKQPLHGKANCKTSFVSYGIDTRDQRAAADDRRGSLDDGEPRFRHENWKAVFDNQVKSTPLTLIAAADPLFSLPLGENREDWEVSLPKEKVWDRFSTLSQIALLNGEDLQVSMLVDSCIVLISFSAHVRRSMKPSMGRTWRAKARMRSKCMVAHILLGPPKYLHRVAAP